MLEPYLNCLKMYEKLYKDIDISITFDQFSI